ncbi:3-hydroxyisobutyryl-CoA hydrolase 1-like isoform X3 [Magnolia sinica]|uniref:3-hydroxyisobutyryl-CoA hydrolase 1-like isoform X3 n=1 Tax=Magnolia sinica TaxID=86752 RepID=UPI0026597D40|nr:3-hydroxyisobutyryl-CoA hydrolase 1-like isoform X3 [Magnolia sinica]
MASNQPSDGVDPQVLIEEKSYVKIITMNRPRQLNALSANMVSQLLKSFIAYEEDANVKLVILKGKGRAFCAGGDVSAVANDVTNGHWKFGANFFRKEFTLNYILATYPKSQVSILNGIVMGGGAGVSIHGKFRVATENSVFAMPETALGLFPDIGASYFLSRLPGFFGEFVGLTGARLDGAEMLACGLATHFVSSSTLPLLEEALFKVDTSDPVVVNSIIEKFSQRVPLKQRSAFLRMDSIDRCFSKRSVEEILYALIREGRLQGVDQCLIREFRMCCHVLRREVSKDFFEGCRALLVDKDKNPKWEPSKLELISNEMVDRYFTKVDDEEWEDLKLPRRPTPTISAMSKL